jgi:hypothetical protein
LQERAGGLGPPLTACPCRPHHAALPPAAGRCLARPARCSSWPRPTRRASWRSPRRGARRRTTTAGCSPRRRWRGRRCRPACVRWGLRRRAGRRRAAGCGARARRRRSSSSHSGSAAARSCGAAAERRAADYTRLGLQMGCSNRGIAEQPAWPHRQSTPIPAVQVAEALAAQRAAGAGPGLRELGGPRRRGAAAERGLGVAAGAAARWLGALWQRPPRRRGRRADVSSAQPAAEGPDALRARAVAGEGRGRQRR